MEAVEFNPVIQPLFDKIDRSAIMILPGEIYYQWGRCVHRANSDFPYPEPELYLIPGFESQDEVTAFIKTFYDFFFQHELQKWEVDPSFWPVNRTYEMFRKWFDVTLIQTIKDTLVQPVFKESENIFFEEPEGFNWFDESDLLEKPGWYEDAEDPERYSFIPKPGLCLTCCKEYDEEEGFMCDLIRWDQDDGKEFYCEYYEPLN